jgi:rRNA processing protein Gar1
MELLGKVRCVRGAGRVLIKGNMVPRERAKVYDGRGREFGEVEEIFGRIDEPFILVKTGRPVRNANEIELYVREVEADDNKKGSKRRR